MTDRIALTLEQAKALKPGDRFRNLETGVVSVVVKKQATTSRGKPSSYVDEKYVWSVREDMYTHPEQNADEIFKFDEMAAYQGV